MNRHRRLTIIAAVLAFVASWCAAAMADLAAGSMLDSGQWRPLMIDGAYFGFFLLLLSALLALFFDRVSGVLLWLGRALVLPWASWLLLPGLWCRIDPCPRDYPAFTGNPLALAMVLLPAAAVWLRRRHG